MSGRLSCRTTRGVCQTASRLLPVETKRKRTTFQSTHLWQAQRASDCLTKGYHIKVVEAFEKGDSRSAVKQWKCKNCGLEGWSRPRRKRRERARRSEEVRIDVPVSIPDISGCGEVEPDVLLDSLSYLGTGRWSTFQQLAKQVFDAPWYPASIGRVLSALGHIDIELDPFSLQPLAWQVSPSALVVVGTSEAVLVGRRSRVLLDKLAEMARDFGGRVTLKRAKTVPKTVSVVGLDYNALWLLARRCSDPLGKPLRFVRNFPLRLAARLPSLADLAQALPCRTSLSTDAEHFDSPKRTVETGR